MKIEQLASEVPGIARDKFIVFTTEALTGEGSGFSYHIIDHSNGVKQLFYKKMLSEISVKFKNLSSSTLTIILFLYLKYSLKVSVKVEPV